MKNTLSIVAVTGMPGAGKSTAARGLIERGWVRVVMGDVVRKETRRRGLEADSNNTGDVMRDLRRIHGEAAVALLSLGEIKSARKSRVVVDGIRSMAEVEEFRKAARVLLVAVHASPARRYALLKERGRSDDPYTREMFEKRDERELDVGIGRAIAMADEVLTNEHNSPEGLSRKMTEVVERWMATDAS